MSFLSIVMLVLTALIILSLLIASAIIWLVYWIAGKKNKNNMPASGSSFTWSDFGNSTTTGTRKKARNVTTKDIDK